MELNNNFCIQFGAGRIPGPTVLSVFLPISYTTYYSVVGGATDYLTDGLFGDFCVVYKDISSFNLDWSNGYASALTWWITVGY